VQIGFFDLQGLWEGRETASSFSALSIDRHFLALSTGVFNLNQKDYK